MAGVGKVDERFISGWSELDHLLTTAPMTKLITLLIVKNHLGHFFVYYQKIHVETSNVERVDVENETF